MEMIIREGDILIGSLHVDVCYPVSSNWIIITWSEFKFQRCRDMKRDALAVEFCAIVRKGVSYRKQVICICIRVK